MSIHLGKKLQEQGYTLLEPDDADEYGKFVNQQVYLKNLDIVIFCKHVHIEWAGDYGLLKKYAKVMITGGPPSEFPTFNRVYTNIPLCDIESLEKMKLNLL